MSKQRALEIIEHKIYFSELTVIDNSYETDHREVSGIFLHLCKQIF